MPSIAHTPRHQQAQTSAKVLRLRPGRYFSVDLTAYDRHAKALGAIGFAVYVALCRYANRRTGECWPAVRRIADDLSLGVSTVREYLHKLADVGLLEIEERFSPAGDHTSNLYRLLDPSAEAIARRKEGVPQELEGGPPEAGGQEPKVPQPEKENHSLNGSTPELPELIKRQEACPHPAHAVRHFGDEATICTHCYVMLPRESRDILSQVA